MIYLSGHVREALEGYSPYIGFIMTRRMRNYPDLSQTKWGADTACFSEPDYYNEERYLEWLDIWPRETALFATAPDVLGDAKATIALAAPVLDKLRLIGFPAALVAQDGLESCTVPWDDFDVLFVGGSTEWKLGPAVRELLAEARQHEKRIHVGRVNSYKRLQYFHTLGAASVDGTFLRYGFRKNLPRLLRWFEKLHA